MERSEAFALPGRVTRVPNILMMPAPAAGMRLAALSAALEHTWRSACSSTHALLEELDPFDPHLRNFAKAHHPGMFDELSAYAHHDDLYRDYDLGGKRRQEFDAAETALGLGSFARCETSADFIQGLRTLHGLLAAGPSELRQGPMALRPDHAGNVVHFPHHSHCDPLLTSLYQFIKTHSDQYRALCAVVAYAGVIHAHPFRDGNGRTARVLFNLLMRQWFETPHFLPLLDMMVLSESGFLIKLRRALYGGEWEPLASFFVQAIRVSDSLQRNGLAHS